MTTRRKFLFGATALGGTVAVGALTIWPQPDIGEARSFEVNKTPEEWRQILSPAEYAVLREEATERAFSSPLNSEKRVGIFTCAGCKLDLYSSKTKFDSGTGWPSFTASLLNAVGTKVDHKLFLARTEVHCRRCGGHLGHIFDDGPAPTGKRHCINGLALNFRAT